jgi:phenylacetate-CoA oxygenase PaaI subunit
MRFSRGAEVRMPERSRVDVLLELADDELLLGWRNSEWTGIAPFLEEDVAFSSIAQNEIGHARALYELAAAELGTTADELAFDRKPEEYRSAPLVELRRLEWARTIARHWLYETADEIRLAALKESEDPEVAGLAAKIDREEVYHRMHADMWIDRLLGTDEGRARLEEAVSELWPYALGVLDDELRPQLRARAEARLGHELPEVDAIPRGVHEAELAELWEEMTSVRRSAPPGSQW